MIDILHQSLLSASRLDGFSHHPSNRDWRVKTLHHKEMGRQGDMLNHGQPINQRTKRLLSRGA